MRIYEFAKKYDISNKKLIELLHKEGFKVSSHMAVLGDKEYALLTSLMNQKKASHEKKIVHEKSDSPVSAVSHQTEQKEKSLVKSEEVETKTNVQTPVQTSATKISEEMIELPYKTMLIDEIAAIIKKPASELIVLLLKWGILATKNQKIQPDIVARIAQHYQIPLSKTGINGTVKSATKTVVLDDSSLHLDQPKTPVVVVIGHVDHGKTTLLDFIRRTRVVAKEKGGITQHIGAYLASTKQGNIVFIDTPGHEAFTKIRQRGLRAADIAILVVAADDGVMPQTIEAIKQAKEMKLTMIVAINKIDKVDSNRLDVVKRQLAQYDVLTEDWGGDIVCVPISAKLGTGIDKLLEMVSLQAELMELKTSDSVPARGYILETKIEKGRGAVATLLLSRGTVSIGDWFTCGRVMGHVTSITDSTGASLQKVGPCVPVQIAGFEELAEAGDLFAVASKEEVLKMQTQKKELSKQSADSSLQAGALNILIKADTDSTREALIDAIHALNKKSKKQFNIIRASIGVVNEGDIEFAYGAQADIVALHARIDPKASLLAINRKVTIHHFEIIYKLIEFLQQWAAAESVETITVRKKIGTAEVLRVFDIKNVGIIAGCIVRDGRFVRDGLVVVLRASRKVGEGKIKSLQREKRVVKEIHAGFECAFVVDGFDEWQVGDQVDCFVTHTETK